MVRSDDSHLAKNCGRIDVSRVGGNRIYLKGKGKTENMKKLILALFALFPLAFACGNYDDAADETAEDFGTVEQALANDVGHAPAHYFDGFGGLAYHAEPPVSVTDPHEYGVGVPCYSTDTSSSNHVGPWSKWTTSSRTEFCIMPAINSLRDVYYVWSGVDVLVRHPTLGDLVSAKDLANEGCHWMQSEIGAGLKIHCFEGTSFPSGKYGVVVSLDSTSFLGLTTYTSFSRQYVIPGGNMAYSLGATCRFGFLKPGFTACSNEETASQCEWVVENTFEHEFMHAIGFAHSLDPSDTMYAAAHKPNDLSHIALKSAEILQISSYAPYTP